jgi:hypothetical protein
MTYGDTRACTSNTGEAMDYQVPGGTKIYLMRYPHLKLVFLRQQKGLQIQFNVAISG